MRYKFSPFCCLFHMYEFLRTRENILGETALKRVGNLWIRVLINSGKIKR
jgi:hypothetical protein